MAAYEIQFVQAAHFSTDPDKWVVNEVGPPGTFVMLGRTVPHDGRMKVAEFGEKADAELFVAAKQGGTDYEAFLRIVERLGLIEADASMPLENVDYSDSTGCPEAGRVVKIGSGDDGTEGAVAAFYFDPEGRAIGHAVVADASVLSPPVEGR